MVKQTKEYFSSLNTVVEWWNPESHHLSHIFEMEIDIIKKYLFDNFTIEQLSKMNVVEVSCGKGRLAIEIYKYFNSYTVVDISEDMINIVKSKVPDIKYYLCDAENMKMIEQNSFDMLFCTQALVHYENPELAIGEFYRIVKNNSPVIVSYDRRLSIRRIIKDPINFIFKKISSDFKVLGGGLYYPFYDKDIRSIVSNKGFLIKDLVGFGAFPSVRIQLLSGDDFYIINSKTSIKLTNFFKNYENLFPLKNICTYALIFLEKKDV